MKFRGSLKNILTLNFFVITVVPVLIIGGVVLAILSRHLTYNIAEQNSLLVDTLGREVQTSLEKSEATLRQLADIIEKGDTIPQGKINAHLNSIIEHHEELEMIRLLDENGAVTHIAPFSSNYMGINMSYQPFVQATMTSLKSHWSSIFRSSQTRQPTIALTIPLNRGSIIIGYLNLKSLKAIADKIRIGTLGYAFIVDSEGTFIAHPNQSYVDERTNLKNISEITRLPSEVTNTSTLEIQGKKVFYSTKTVACVNWGITIIQPFEEAFASYRKIRNTILTGIIAALALVLFLAIIIPKKILQPLYQLTEYSKRVTAGDKSIFNYQKSYKEVNKLAKNFDIMLDSLKNRENQLRESEERYKLATKASDNGIWDWWTHSEDIYFSDQWKAQLGYAPHELQHKMSTWQKLLHPECKSRVINRVKEFLNNPSGYFLEEFRMQHKDGSYRWIANKASAVLDDGKVVRMFGSHTDITDKKDNEKTKKSLEKQIAQFQKLESLGVMAGGIAHNFNNNLAIIMGNTELLELEVQNNQYALSCLADSTVAIKRSKDLIDQILTFSRRGSIENPSNFIVPVFNETLTLLKSSLPGSVEISVDLDVKLEDKLVSITPSQLQEILINLCNNAVYAMKEEGNLTISIALQDLSQQEIPMEHHNLKAGEYVELKITDNGPGIPKTVIDKIFDPFFTTKPIHEGTGMGLSMVQGIVGHSKGFITVDHDLDIGSTFTLYFKTTNELPLPKEESKRAIKGKNESILLVDDEPSLAKLGKRLLERNGYQVTSLTNPEEALDIIKTDPERFQLVITDQLMPQMTGDELLGSILKINPKVKTIVCSGNVDKVAQQTIDKIGVEFILKKPLNHENLLNKIRILFDQ